MSTHCIGRTYKIKKLYISFSVAKCLLKLVTYCNLWSFGFSFPSRTQNKAKNKIFVSMKKTRGFVYISCEILLFNFEMHWSPCRVSQFCQMKLVDCNQVLGNVADGNWITKFHMIDAFEFFFTLLFEALYYKPSISWSYLNVFMGKTPDGKWWEE